MAGILVALAVAVLVPSWGRFAPDTRPDLYQQPGRLLSSTLQAWVGGGSGLGQGNFNTGIAPVAVVIWVIRALGAPAWLAVRIWRFLLLVIAAAGIRRYLGALFGDRLSIAGRVLVTAFYVVNPYVIVGANTTPILLPYTLLPWTLLAFVRATRHPRSWRWPAAFAIAFFLQTGLNAGVVPLFGLLALPAHAVYARLVEGVSWRDLTRVVVRCGVLAVAVSVYWLVPSLLASGTGAGIAATTESHRDVARSSSYAETARLLGNWPLYGRSGQRLFLPEYSSYLTNPFVVIASFLLPVGAALAVVRSRARERLLGTLLLVAGLPVMVGIFPPDNPPPWGRVLRAAFDRVPASLAFRTTNKVGAVVVVGYAVLLAAGAGVWWRRLRGDGPRLVAAGVVATILLVASHPLWSGGLYPGSYRLPGYWTAATARLDQRDPASRVLVVPGGTGGNYRWGVRSPDDLFPSLLRRPITVRSTVVAAGDPAANFLAGFDTMLQQGLMPPGGLSTVARYLGASDVLVRNDLLTEEIAGAEPWQVVSQVKADGGLTLDRSFGRPGQNTLPGTAALGSDAGTGPSAAASDPRNAALRPLQVWRVARPQPVVTAAPAQAQVFVDGDGEAVPNMAAFGIVDGTQPVRLLGGVDDAGLVAAASDRAGFVLTDTNRRRAADINRVTNFTSPTLAADQPLTSGNGASLTLWPEDTGAQSVAEVVGARSITASLPAFGLRPFGKPAFAFDGNPFTAWTTGELGTAAGQQLSIRFAQRLKVGLLTIRFATGQPSRIDAIAITTDTGRVVEQVPTNLDTVTYALPPAITSSLQIQILHQTAGSNPVGIAEVTVPKLATTEIVRMPTTYDRLVRATDDDTRARIAALPLDVVMTRAAGSVSDATDDEEVQIDRRFLLPQPRLFTLDATIPFDDLDDATRRALLALAPGQPAPCRTVGFVDGRPLTARATSPASQLLPGHPVRLAGCAPVLLDAGSHRLTTAFGWRLDRLRLHSAGARPAAAASGPRLTIRHRQATALTIDAGVARGAYLVRLGQSYDPRWRLTMDGHDLGPPILVDGYSSGWRITDTRPHRFVATFPPQQAVRATVVASAAAVVGVVGIVAWPTTLLPPWVAWRRRDGGDQPVADEPAGAGS